MKRFYFLVLLAVLAALYLAENIGRDPGYILLSIGGYSIEMTFWVGLLLLLLLTALLLGLSRLLAASGRGARRLVGRSPTTPSRVYRIDRTSKAASLFISGDWRRARRQLQRAADRSEAPLLNYLLAARASHEHGDREEAEALLGKASEQGAAADAPVKLTRAELQLQAGDPAAALLSLESLAPGAGRTPQAIRLKIEACRSLHRWQELNEQLDLARRRKAMPTDRIERLERECALGLLQTTAESLPLDLEKLQQLWRRLPTKLRKDERIVARYASLLAGAGNGDQAEALLRAAINRSWDAGLVSLYGRTVGADSSRQLGSAEAWLQQRPDDPVLLLALGRLCLANKLWGKARDYLEDSVARDPSPEACAELGRLYNHLGEHGRSREMFERGLLSSTTALPSLPMPD